MAGRRIIDGFTHIVGPRSYTSFSDSQYGVPDGTVENDSISVNSNNPGLLAFVSGKAGDDELITVGSSRVNLVGDAGSDILFGGRGSDIFYAFADRSVDEIRDFENSIDRIDLSGLGLSFSDLVIAGDGRVSTRISTADGSVQLLVKASVIVLDPGQIDASDFIF